MRHFERRLQYRIFVIYLLIAIICGITGTVVAVARWEPFKQEIDIPLIITGVSWGISILIIFFGWGVRLKKAPPDFDYYLDVDENFIWFNTITKLVYLEHNVICFLRPTTLDLYDDNGGCIEDIGYDEEVIQFLKKYPRIYFVRWQE